MKRRLVILALIAIPAVVAAQTKTLPTRTRTVAARPLSSAVSRMLLKRFSATHYTYERQWGTYGWNADGKWVTISRLAISPAGTIFMIDISEYYPCVQEFSPSGVFIRRWNGNGTPGPCHYGECLLKVPTSLALGPDGKVYATCLTNQVHKFDTLGVYERAWGRTGPSAEQMESPHDVAIDREGNVYVADINHFRILKYTSDGQWIRSWGTQGTGVGQFTHPLSVAVDRSSDWVYVADASNRIQKFTLNGDFLLQWGSTGEGDGQFYTPEGLAVDAAGNVYAADYQNSRIQKFTSEGAFMAKWGEPGQGAGHFSAPVAVAVDDKGNVYVADQGNTLIQKFRPVFP